jgi:hypothetical protein
MKINNVNDSPIHSGKSNLTLYSNTPNCKIGIQ